MTVRRIARALAAASIELAASTSLAAAAAGAPPTDAIQTTRAPPTKTSASTSARAARASPAAPTPTASGSTASASSAAPGGAAVPAAAAAAPAATRTRLDALNASDRGQVAAAIAAIAEPGSGADADLLFAAARACEDKLGDLVTAAALYERILTEYSSARVAGASAHRAAALRAQIGPHGETAAQARELAQLIARAEDEPPDAVLRQGDQLAAAAWPGAPRAALWVADWLRRKRRCREAGARYAAIAARWPAAGEGHEARRDEAGCALDMHDWNRAEALALRLPVDDPSDRLARGDLLAAVVHGRRRGRWYVVAWLAAVVAFGALGASLAEAVARGPRGSRRRALRPPIETVFAAPVAAVLIIVAYATHRLIAPVVTTLATGGVALSWLSGAALEQLRASGPGRRQRLRTVGHAVLCLVGVAALAYAALTREHLIDALIETVQFGPEK